MANLTADKLAKAIDARNRAVESYRAHNCRKCEEDAFCQALHNAADRITKADAKVIELGGVSVTESGF